MLLFALERCRAALAWKARGLDAAALHHPHPPSAMTLGGWSGTWPASGKAPDVIRLGCPGDLLG